MNADEVEVVDGDVADSSAAFGWDDRLSPHVEWSAVESWPRARRGWLVWRGEGQWAVTPDLVERAWALFHIGVSVADEARGDLRALRAHIPRMRSLRIESEAKLRGYGALGRGRALELLEIRSRAAEEVDLTRLRQLRTYRGPAFGAWATVLQLPSLEELTLDSDVPDTISAPLRLLHLGSPKVRRLPELSVPGALRELSAGHCARFDLASLAPATGLRTVRVSATRITGLRTLASLPLTDLTLEGGTDEDTGILADLATPTATLWLKAQWTPEVIDTAVTRDWAIKVPHRVWRAALERAGRSYVDSQYADVIAPADVGDIFIDGRTLRATFISEPDDLPPDTSPVDAQARLVPRLTAQQGAAFAASLTWKTDSSRLIVECPDIASAHVVAEVAASLFVGP